MSKLNSIEQTLKQLKQSGIATSGVAAATEEAETAATTAHEELMAAANDPTANLPFMAKLKIVSESIIVIIFKLSEHGRVNYLHSLRITGGGDK